ncbi:LytS/YehU family sensor histidine kinase [Lutibacter sp. Hel_I_33_5]|uniref:2TM domain-containing protein n=1 Tax=Lutibacter sp. Hel_I_33_5 TaxID=1566289 RepID=UPI0011A40E89|nr:2TM domain-containing protein [Lutibacter sp. Hel_I_33_5]TVZ55157.1 LytS/YehU family sensor histidine kinase [Lutibacter sp. Hel_I_33_5]
MSINTTMYSKKELKNDLLVCLKVALVFALIFVVINRDFSLESIGNTFLISSMYSFGLGLGNGLINKWLSKKWSWITQTNQRVWAAVVSTIIYTCIVVFLIQYIQYVLIFGHDFDNIITKDWVYLSYFFGVVISLGVATFFHAKGFMHNWKASFKQESTQQQIVAKTETAKFETLKSQLDPHFLFNSLNVLTSLIGENPNQAEKFTTKLSKVYRYVLEQRNKELVPLSEELHFARTYMELLQMRFEDAVKFNIPTEIGDSDLKIVPLSLQLLLENAVKHNVVSSTKPLEINIFEENGFLQIQNNINPKEAIGKSTKVGLRNIADRYGLITDKTLQITNNNKTFTVSLPLLRKTNNMTYNTNDLENSKYVKAIERVEKLKEFYQNLVSYCLVIPFLIFINLNTAPQFQWFWFPMIGWGIGLLFHFLEVNNYSIFLGKNWEDRKIKEMMDNNKKF